MRISRLCGVYPVVAARHGLVAHPMNLYYRQKDSMQWQQRKRAPYFGPEALKGRGRWASM